jgi:hypothetical protein
MQNESTTPGGEAHKVFSNYILYNEIYLVQCIFEMQKPLTGKQKDVKRLSKEAGW